MVPKLLRRLVPAAVAGMCLPLAFAPVGWSLLAIAALAVLFWGWYASSPRVAAAQGYVFGIGLFAVGVPWLYISLHRFGGMSGLLALVLLVLFIAFLAVFPALVGFLWARGFPRNGRGLVFGVPVLWVGSEWLRARVFTGFPWLSVGYSQMGHALGDLAPYGGIYGVSWATATTAALLALLFRVPHRRQRMVALIALVALISVSGLLRRISWIRPDGPTVVVALVQGNIPEEIKWTPGELGRIVHRYLALMRGTTLAHARARIAIWPETAIPDYFSALEPSVLPQLKRYVRAHRMWLLFGLVEDRRARVYNSVALLGSGRMQWYRKQHLVPFGEYLPWPWLLQPLLDYLRIPMSNFNVWRGTEGVLSAGPQRLGVSICYEDAFSRHVRQTLPQATLLVNVSDDGWFGHSWAREQHLQIARMRAAEAGRWLLSDTNDGITAAIGPHGTERGRLPSFHRGVLSVAVQPYVGATPYIRYGNWPLLLWAAVSLVVAWRTQPRRC